MCMWMGAHTDVYICACMYVCAYVFLVVSSAFRKLPDKQRVLNKFLLNECPLVSHS